MCDGDVDVSMWWVVLEAGGVWFGVGVWEGRCVVGVWWRVGGEGEG